MVPSSAHQLFDVIPQGSAEGGVSGSQQVFIDIQKQSVSDSVPTVEDPDPNPQRVSKTEVLLKEIMFSKVLTPNDVGELNSLLIPKISAEKYFPNLSFVRRKSCQLYFKDPAGKLWSFRYRYRGKIHSYVLTKGWSCFVKENLLHAGDTVSFSRRVGGTRKDNLFIDWTIKAEAAPVHLSPPPVSNVGSLMSAPVCVSDNQPIMLDSAGVSDIGPCRPSMFAPNFVDDNFMSSSGWVSDTHAHDSFMSASPYTLGPDVNPSGFLDPGISLKPACPSSPFHNKVVNGSVPIDGRIVKDALLYCFLFPPDYEFEKETMVQLWMADEIFVEEPMEKEAHLFFEYCLGKCYFQFCRTNSITGRAMYKFNADSHLNTLLTTRRIQFARIEGISYLNDISPEVSHVSIRCHNLQDSTAFCSFKKFEQLRTLIFFQACELRFKHVSWDFFLSLGLLRVLDLSQARLMELPSSLGKMKNLCYLDLSDTPIKRLPEAIDCLTNIQTLKLRGCSNLSTLPKGMRKLVNLRYLDFDVLRQLQSMPQGMGALTSLRTLSAFLVGVEEGCSIRQLKNMNNISGSFCISRLENVLSENEVEEACLSNKTQIRKLELHWSDSQDEDVGYGKILSSLQPNSSLEELCVSCYGDFELPNWICDPAFSKLVSITLFEFENCLVLPSLGELPSLKFLNIVDFHKLKVIGRNFCGGVGTPGYIAFPKLESLTVENMLDLEEWSGIGNSDFPHLLKLTIKNCPKLHSLCTLSCLYSLENLEISHCAVIASCLDDKLPAQVETFIIEGCPLLSEKVLNHDGQDWLMVAHIPHVWIDHQELSVGQGSSQGVRDM